MNLTRTQRAALALLTQTGAQWPAGRGRYAGGNNLRDVRYSRRTLQALVDAGHARWVHTPGLMPHIVPTTTTDPGTTSSSPGRSYTIGCPVTITLNDDGSIAVVVYLGEAGEGVADYVDFDDDGNMIDNPTQDDDVARIMAAIDAGHVTTTHSKGA